MDAKTYENKKNKQKRMKTYEYKMLPLCSDDTSRQQLSFQHRMTYKR